MQSNWFKQHARYCEYCQNAIWHPELQTGLPFHSFLKPWYVASQTNVSSFLSQNNLPEPQQSGFKTALSTETLIAPEPRLSQYFSFSAICPLWPVLFTIRSHPTLQISPFGSHGIVPFPNCTLYTTVSLKAQYWDPYCSPFLPDPWAL